DSQMIISAGRARFALPCLPADDFPMMAGAPLQFRFKVSPDDLVALIDKTKFAISNEETRYYLNGIYLHTVEVKGQQILRAAASDGFRLSLYDIPAPEGSKGMPGVIVPKQVIGELRKLIDDASEDITVEVSETKTRFSFEQAIMTSKLIDGKYPNYSAIIPKGNDKILSVNTALFKEAVDRVSSVSVDKFRSVKLSLNKNTLVLSASTPEAGSGTEQLEANYVGEKLEAVFRYKQILDMTYQIETDEIHLLFSDGTSPVIMKEKDNDHFIYVLMPLRL
ncbi:MAG: DNA polymerase III subunit beta, partial [Alphaproteobacteria bacterium]|nr:DNA polymerase III subunit beta [Alphaproteobacteria bacterium]